MTATMSRECIRAEIALEIAVAGLEASSQKGLNLAVSVVDCSALPLVVLRSDLGSQQFVEGSMQKAWTAVNFKLPTRELFEMVMSGEEALNQLPNVPNALFLMGGIPLMSGDAIVGGVGVAGSSGPDDHQIAQIMADAFHAAVKQV